MEKNLYSYNTKIIYTNGVYYGYINENGQPDGLGQFFWNNTCFAYYGCWKDGKMNGLGCMVLGDYVEKCVFNNGNKEKILDSQFDKGHCITEGTVQVPCFIGTISGSSLKVLKKNIIINNPEIYYPTYNQMNMDRYQKGLKGIKRKEKIRKFKDKVLDLFDSFIEGFGNVIAEFLAGCFDQLNKPIISDRKSNQNAKINIEKINENVVDVSEPEEKIKGSCITGYSNNDDEDYGYDNNDEDDEDYGYDNDDEDDEDYGYDNDYEEDDDSHKSPTETEKQFELVLEAKYRGDEKEALKILESMNNIYFDTASCVYEDAYGIKHSFHDILKETRKAVEENEENEYE